MGVSMNQSKPNYLIHCIYAGAVLLCMFLYVSYQVWNRVQISNEIKAQNEERRINEAAKILKEKKRQKYWRSSSFALVEKTIFVSFYSIRKLYESHKVSGDNFDKNIEVFPLALGDRAEYKEIYGLSETASLVKGWMSENKSTDIVYCSTMDNILNVSDFKNKQIMFLIDVEGFEKKVLDGAINFVKMQTKPIWIIEIIDNLYVEKNPDYIATFKYFFDNDYLCFDIQDNLRQINLQDLTPPRSSNFLFVDKNKSFF